MQRSPRREIGPIKRARMLRRLTPRTKQRGGVAAKAAAAISSQSQECNCLNGLGFGFAPRLPWWLPRPRLRRCGRNDRIRRRQYLGLILTLGWSCARGDGEPASRGWGRLSVTENQLLTFVLPRSLPSCPWPSFIHSLRRHYRHQRRRRVFLIDIIISALLSPSQSCGSMHFRK